MMEATNSEWALLIKSRDDKVLSRSMTLWMDRPTQNKKNLPATSQPQLMEPGRGKDAIISLLMDRTLTSPEAEPWNTPAEVETKHVTSFFEEAGGAGASFSAWRPARGLFLNKPPIFSTGARVFKLNDFAGAFEGSAFQTDTTPSLVPLSATETAGQQMDITLIRAWHPTKRRKIQMC